MPDVSYSVEVLYHSRGKIDGGLDSAKDKGFQLVKTLTSGAESVSGAFNSAFDSIASSAITGMAAAGAAVGGLLAIGMSKAVKEAFAFNSQMEMAQISLAAIAQSGGLADSMGQGMQMSAGIIAEMRKDARELPGEFKDLQNIMATIAMPGMQAGKSFGQIEKFAAKGMAAAEIVHVSQPVAARELAMLLEGNAKHSMPLANRLGLGDLKAFNKLAPATRFEKVSGSLSNLVDPALDAMKNSWIGIKTTFIDSIRQATGMVGGPLYSRVKDLVKSFNDMPESAKEKWRTFGAKIGSELVKAFDWGKAAIEQWSPYVEAFAKTMYAGFRDTFHGIGRLLEPLLGKLATFMVNPQAYDQLVHVGKLLLAARIGSGAIGIGAKGLGLAAPLLGSSGLIGSAVGASVLGPAALVVVGALMAVGSVFHVLADGASMFHEQAVRSFNNIYKSGQHIFESLGHVFEVIGPPILGLVNIMGGTFLFSIETLVTWMDIVVTSLDRAAKGFVDFINVILATLHMPLVKLGPDQGESFERNWMHHENHRSDADAEREREPKVVNHHTTVHKVEINVNSNQDPSRIAKATFDVIQDVALNPRVSEYDPNAPFKRGRSY